MQSIGLLVRSMLTVMTICLASKLSAAEPPNVLFIAIDDLNDWVGCLNGHPNSLTPNIDRLAKRGLVFSNAHCQAPICGPSRASLFTGLLPTTSGIYGQITDRKIKSASPATASAIFLPDYFERYGYQTLACGKLFHGGDRAKVFDDYGGHASFGPKPQQRMHYDPAWFPEKIGGTQTDWGAFPDQDSDMPDFKIAAYGVRQLSEEHEKPFFLACGFMRPHVPWHVPQKWFDMHPLDQIELPPYLENDLDDVPPLARAVNALPAMPTTQWAIEQQQWPSIVQSYLACTTFVDAQVGKLMDALDASDYRDNTLVVLWSDHGYHLGEKDRFAKQALWDRANRIPLIIVPPTSQSNSSFARGQVCHRSVGLIDLYPTLLELCELPPNEANDGHSLVPLLRKSGIEWDKVTITSYGPGNHAVQTDRFRFYRYEDGSMECYDQQADPNEWHNLATKPSMQEMLQELNSHIPTRPAESSEFNKYPTNRYFNSRF